MWETNPLPSATTTGGWSLWAPTGNIWVLQLPSEPREFQVVYYGGRYTSVTLFSPLSPHRACVAGFTNITYNLQNVGLINGDESYVSFSPYSEAVFLPQDPGRGKQKPWCGFCVFCLQKPADHAPLSGG